MAESARLMPVSASPCPLTRAPSPAASPRTRLPKGVEINVSHRAHQKPALPQPASQPAPRANCATDPACRTKAATPNVKLLQSRQRPAPAKTCANRVVTTRRQPVVTTRKLPQLPWAVYRQQRVTARSDGLKARRIRRSRNAICMRPAPRGPCQPRHPLAHLEPLDKGSPR